MLFSGIRRGILSRFGLMSWQAYKNHRFRKARRNLYKGDIHDSLFPFEPGLVSIFLTVEEQNQSSLRDLISKLLDQTYRYVEIILISGDVEISKHLLSDLSIEEKEKIRIIHIIDKSPKDHVNSSCPKGEFSTWFGKDCKFEPDFIERMVFTLRHRPQVGLVYFGDKESGNPLSKIFMTRSYVVWVLGESLQTGNPPENLSFWHQAALVLNLKTFDLSNPDQSDSQLLLDRLEISYAENFRVLGDFYRDYFLTHWICYLQSEGSGHQSTRLLSHLKNAALKSGNFLYEEMVYQQEEFPGSWIPEVFILVVEGPEVIYPSLPELPRNALKVMIKLSPGHMPESISPEWDVCFTMGKLSEKPTLLKKSYQGCIASKNVSSLINILDMRIHAHYCHKIQSLMLNQERAGLKASVVISTYRREKPLRCALQSVARQTFPLDEYEVIVVNNDPSDKLVCQLVEEIRSRDFSRYPEHLRLIQCPLPGLSNARNAGMSEAQGEVICFLDDDAIAHENWLEQICQAFSEHPKAGVIGGHIILNYPKPRPKVLKEGLERFWGNFITSFDRYTEVHDTMDFPWGGNWCVRRKVLLEIGGFRSMYGKHRGDYNGGEEIIAAILAQKLGYTVAILPTAEVEHRPDTTRFTFEYLCNTITSQIITNYRMNRDLYLPKATSIASNIRGIGRFAENFLAMLRLSRKEREALSLEYFYYINAWFRLFFEQMGDTIVRFWYQK